MTLRLSAVKNCRQNLLYKSEVVAKLAKRDQSTLDPRCPLPLQLALEDVEQIFSLRAREASQAFRTLEFFLGEKQADSQAVPEEEVR